MIKSNNNYFAGEHPMEGRRLFLKANCREFIQQYLLPHLRPGIRIVDVGGGPGIMAREIVEMVPEIRKIDSLEVSVSRHKMALALLKNLSNAEAIQGDAYSLPYKSNSLDLVLSRFVLQHLPQPQKVVREMMRVCRPGGRIFLSDTDSYHLMYYPMDTKLQNIIDLVMRILKKTGFDPLTGRQLYSFCQQAGLNQIDVSVHQHKLIAGKIDSQSLQFLEMEFEVANNAFLEAFGSQKAADIAKQYIYEYAKRENTISFGNLFNVTGVVG